MKNILNLFKKPVTNHPTLEDSQESVFFSTALTEKDENTPTIVPWKDRSIEINATPFAPGQGYSLLQAFCAKNKYMAHLQSGVVERLGSFLEFVKIPSGNDVIKQDEYGNFLFFLLSGAIAVNRVQPRGERLLLAETLPGDILGEMSLLDSGIRFSACTTVEDSEIAVLTADAMDYMMTKDAHLAASLAALLARKLSLRLRAVSSRLGGN